MENETKKCSKCGEVKKLSEFHKKKAAKDGLKYRCKKCESIYSETKRCERLSWAKNNKDKMRIYGIKHRDLHKDEINANSRYNIENLTDEYIIYSCLKLKSSQAEEYRDIIELKRVQILINRELKK